MCPVMLVLLEIGGAKIGWLSETVRFSSSELRKIGQFNPYPANVENRVSS
jgi:hypothetical protein